MPEGFGRDHLPIILCKQAGGGCGIQLLRLPPFIRTPRNFRFTRHNARSVAAVRYRVVPVIPILGARKLSQLQDNLASLDLALLPDQMKILEEASHIDLGFPQELYAKEFPVASVTVACVTKLPPDSSFGSPPAYP